MLKGGRVFIFRRNRCSTSPEYADLDGARNTIEESYVGRYKSLADFAEGLTEDTTEIPQHLQYYIDMRRYIYELSEREQGRLVKLAQNYYSPQVKALVGLLFTSLKLSVPSSLAHSLNPTTIYKLKLDQSKWSMAREWNIR